MAMASALTDPANTPWDLMMTTRVTTKIASITVEKATQKVTPRALQQVPLRRMARKDPDLYRLISKVVGFQSILLTILPTYALPRRQP